MELRPGQRVDRYKVESVIASGGMATVYRVRHTTLDTLHALKVLLLPAKHLMERLIQEGKAQAQLRHPNIVAVTDVVEVDGAPGLVMELIQGPTLHELVRAQRLTIEQADALGRDIIRAVAHAHDHGMIHRDLKPANVMLSIDRGELIPKVTDFGLAKLLTLQSGTDKTASGLAMGTPSYMAPEQYRDAKNVDRRADVFSLGTILYELVTSRRCFGGEEMIEVYQNIANGVYADPRELAPGLPERMADAIDGCLETNPDDRIADCDALLELWCGGAMTRPRRSSAHPGTWSEDLLEEAAALAGSSGAGGAVAVSTDEGEGEAGEATRLPPPTLDPGSDIGSSDTLYASLEPGPNRPPTVPPLTGGPDAGPPEEEEAHTPAPITASPRRDRSLSPVVLGIVFLLGLSVPVALGIGVYLGGGFSGDEPQVIEAPTPAPAEAPEPTEAPEPEPTPQPEPVDAPEPTTPAPTPTPVAPTPSPVPKPAPVATGTVLLEGDGTARLRDQSGGFHDLGAVPEGTYTLLVTFPGKSERDKGTVSVRPGRTLTATCDARFNRCKIR